MFECLNSIKVPSGFFTNVKGIINMTDKKFLNLKSYDWHVLMMQLVPVALRGILPSNVRLATVKLCAFLNTISQKTINPAHLETLHNDVVQCLVSFETFTLAPGRLGNDLKTIVSINYNLDSF
jgi:hypothetical protein